MRILPLLVVTLAAFGCKRKEEPTPRETPNTGSGAALPGRAHDAISRTDFNRFAVRQNLPVYWIADANNNKTLDPDEVAPLLFYGVEPPVWAERGAFTKDFEAAYDTIVAASKAPAPDTSTPEGKRLALVQQDLDAGRPTLVYTNFSKLSEQDRAFVLRMLSVANLIDEVYETQNGAKAAAAKLPADPESRSLFRRNRGPKCEGPVSSKDPACSAIPGAPKHTVDIYPVELQAKDTFCADLQERKDAATLMGHFNVVRGTGDALSAVPYTEAYKLQMSRIAEALTGAAGDMKDASEEALVAYLKAAAASFASNDWGPADEAWSRMSVRNSAWYVRVGPDETYWEPCSLKAGFHLTLARINRASRPTRRTGSRAR